MQFNTFSISFALAEQHLIQRYGASLIGLAVSATVVKLADIMPYEFKSWHHSKAHASIIVSMFPHPLSAPSPPPPCFFPLHKEQCVCVYESTCSAHLQDGQARIQLVLECSGECAFWIEPDHKPVTRASRESDRFRRWLQERPIWRRYDWPMRYS
ncbi:hypothetical protein RRG08_055241 [Elysia crispata]|uniref:Uncharacterized protein n=1 Tax=Elysia crispata TaxID=231223 RepID=A0AAE1CMP6_9GAST|nr:hypothetical protein RRG08_055241 [Elysia crispata]